MWIKNTNGCYIKLRDQDFLVMKVDGQDTVVSCENEEYNHIAAFRTKEEAQKVLDALMKELVSVCDFIIDIAEVIKGVK